MEAAEEAGEAVASALHNFLLFLQTAARLNYQLVSSLLAALHSLSNGVVYCLRCLETGLVELAEQYGELCGHLIQGLGWGLGSLLSLASNLSTASAEAVSSSIGAGQWTMSVLGDLFLLPFRLLKGTAQGLWMMVAGLWHAVVWGWTQFFHFWAWVLGGIASFLYALAASPWRMARFTVLFLVERKMALLYLGLFCLLLVLLWRAGVIPAALRHLRRALRRFARWLGGVSLRGIETAVSVHAPFGPLLVAVARRTYRPALRLLRWLCRLLWGRRRGRQPRPGSRADPDRSQSDGRYVPQPRPPLTPQSSRVDEPASPASPSSPERLLCVVCQDAEKSIMLDPCRHICTCEDCADELLGLDGEQRRCPLCRVYIQRLVPVYF